MKGSYMKVESVLRYLVNVKQFNKRVLGLKQYTVKGDQRSNYFKCTDLSDLIGERLFRVMECEVSQLMLLA